MPTLGKKEAGKSSQTRNTGGTKTKKRKKAETAPEQGDLEFVQELGKVPGFDPASEDDEESLWEEENSDMPILGKNPDVGGFRT